MLVLYDERVRRDNNFNTKIVPSLENDFERFAIRDDADSVSESGVCCCKVVVGSCGMSDFVRRSDSCW